MSLDIKRKAGWTMPRCLYTWIREVLLKHTKMQHCLLVFDSFKAHLLDDVLQTLKRENASIVVVPGGCTSKAQPVDVSLNRPIKDTMKGLWEEFMTSSMAHDLVSEVHATTKDDVVEWIVRAHALSTHNQNVLQNHSKCEGSQTI